MTEHPLLIVVLAAGKGVRMRSSIPKVLHAIAGRSMLGHVLAISRAAGAGRIALVVAPGMEAVRAEAEKAAPGIEVFEQATQAGTANAVLAARPAIERHKGDVIVLFADTPLVEPATLRRLVQTLQGGAQVAVLGFEPERSNRLWPPHLQQGRTRRGDPRGARCNGLGAQDRPVQRGRHGFPRAGPRRPARAHSQPQRQE